MGKYNIKDFEAHCATIKRATSITPNESPKVKADRIARAKKDYDFFFAYYFPRYAKAKTAKFHIDLANATVAKPRFRGIFEAFRGAAKSVHGSMALPLWWMIREEMKCLILGSETEEKADRLLASVQAELTANQRFINDFGEQASHGNWSEGEFITKQGTGFFSVGLGQSPRGTRIAEHRPDAVILDDVESLKRGKNPRLIKEAIQWTFAELIPTMDVGFSKFLLLNNRILSNGILANIHRMFVLEKPKDERWYYLRVDALDKHGKPTWPEKYTVEHWKQVRSETPMRSWEREYMNNPIEEGTVFSEKWIKWGPMNPLKEYDQIVIYIDPSFKDTATSDFKAVKTWGIKGRELHLINSFVRQCSLATMVAYCYDEWARLPEDANAAIYMESNFLQDMIFEHFADEGDVRNWQLPLRGDDRKKPDKYSRIEATSPLYERGFVIYNQDKKHDPDFSVAIEQLLAIEPGSKTPDDSPDADEGAFHFLLKANRVNRVNPVIGKHEGRYSW